MKKVILSCTIDSRFDFFLPLTCAWWREIGWDPRVILIGSKAEWVKRVPVVAGAMESFGPFACWYFNKHPNYTEGTTAKVLRHSACWFGNIDDGDYLLLSDIDMWMLSPQWLTDNIVPGNLTIWGANVHALNPGRQFPICYQGAAAKTWQEIYADITANDFFDKRYPERIESPAKRWSDEEAQATILPNWSGFPSRCHFVDRDGSRARYMSGRVDRGNWVYETKDEPGLLDAHLLRPGYTDDNWPRLMRLIEDFLPGWAKKFDAYRNRYVRAMD